MVLGQCTQEMKSKLEGHKGWPKVLGDQDGVTLMKKIHRLYTQQDNRATGLMEIVTLERSIALNVQGKRSKVDYLWAFKANADVINLAGGHAGSSIAATKLVAKEQDLNYEATKAVKQDLIMEEATKRYLTVLAFTRLNSERHTSLKADVKHNWVRKNVDSLPRTYKRLIVMVGGYKTRDRPRRDPRGTGVALINTADRG